MSLIDAVGLAPLRLPMRGALRWGQRGALTTLDHLLLGVRLVSGAVGIAEAAVRPTIYGETTAGMEAALTLHLGPALVGLEVADESATARALAALPFNHALRGALDLALEEARAAEAGTTVAARYAGANPRPRVSAILGIAGEREMLAEAVTWVEAGVHVLKVKVGRDPDHDERVLGALRRELGEHVVLYADANEGWTPSEAPRRLERLARLGAAYVEEPLPVHRLRDRAALRAAGVLPLIADDSAFTPEALERELEADTFDILNIKPARSGWRASRAMLARAREAGKGVMIGSQAGSGLLTRHAAVLAGQVGVTHPSELSFPLRLEADSLDAPPPIAGGELDTAAYATATLRPGLWRPRWLVTR